MEMKRLLLSVLAGALLCLHTYGQETTTMNNNLLSAQQQSLVALAANEAIGNLQGLKEALEQAIDNGLTANQLKEVFAHLYAYTGFPRSLNAQGVLRVVLEEREQAGKPVEAGKEATPLAADYDALR